MLPQVFTYCDAVHDLEEFAREASISAAGRSIRAAIRRAYREIVSTHDWSCLHANGRIQLKASQDDGTVTYDHTGGTYERQVTLVGDTWPDDVIDWAVRIETDEGEIVCDVEERKSDTVITLDATMNPGQDVAAGASYVAYPRYYRLPNNFLSIDQPVEEALHTLGKYVSPGEMLQLDRYYNESGDIRYFTIAPVPDLYGTMGLFVQPHSDTARTLDFMYKIRPRELRYVGTDLAESPGTIVVVAGSNDVAGTTTPFTSGMVGSLLRIGTSTTKLPTGLDGLMPYAEQRTITTYTSATAITLDTGVVASASGVKYSVTDPLDLDAVVYDAMMAMAKKYLAIEKNAKNWSQIAQLAEESLFNAKCGDNRVYSRRVVGVRWSGEQRLADSPRANRYEVP
jgi:hypothetical protein